MLKVCLLYIKQPNTQIKICLTTRLVVNGATRNAQQEIYRLFFGAFERDMLGKGEYQSLYKESDGRLD